MKTAVTAALTFWDYYDDGGDGVRYAWGVEEGRRNNIHPLTRFIGAAAYTYVPIYVRAYLYTRIYNMYAWVFFLSFTIYLYYIVFIYTCVYETISIPGAFTIASKIERVREREKEIIITSHKKPYTIFLFSWVAVRGAIKWFSAWNNINYTLIAPFVRDRPARRFLGLRAAAANATKGENHVRTHENKIIINIYKIMSMIYTSYYTKRVRNTLYVTCVCISDNNTRAVRSWQGWWAG